MAFYIFGGEGKGGGGGGANLVVPAFCDLQPGIRTAEEPQTNAPLVNYGEHFLSP